MNHEKPYFKENLLTTQTFLYSVTLWFIQHFLFSVIGLDGLKLELNFLKQMHLFYTKVSTFLICSINNFQVFNKQG